MGVLAGQVSPLLATINTGTATRPGSLSNKVFAGATAAGYRRHYDDPRNLAAKAGGGADRCGRSLTGSDQPNRNVRTAADEIDRLADRIGISWRMTIAEQ